jgi:hypothetical protein
VDADVTVTAAGVPYALSAPAAKRLQIDLERLIASCSFATPVEREPARLVAEVRYRQPYRFDSLLPGHPQLEVSHIAAAAAEDSETAVYAGIGGLSVLFYKCRGGQVLDALCTAELEPLLPGALRSSCHLAPGRQRE